MTPFEMALNQIDAANAQDPHLEVVKGETRPAELVYGERMSAMLVRFFPNAPEALRLAVRAQHLRRWIVPRDSYPMDRAGYHHWRNDLKRKHAEWASAILSECGYDEAMIARVATLIRKENFKQDPDGQALEDVACLVFLEHYADDFAAKHEPEKVADIFRKTWGKMSERGHTAARTLKLSAGVRALITAALSP